MTQMPKSLSSEARHQEEPLAEISARLEKVSAEERVRWALERFGADIILTTSFGAQSAVSLHMATLQWPDIPVVMIDTGYLFPETYRFADELTQRLKLNLKVYRADISSAWLEARHGKLWEHGLDGIEQYNKMVKVEPMDRALKELGARAWITGLRRQQAKSRAELAFDEDDGNGRRKISPIADWTWAEVWAYVQKYDVPYNPLHDQFMPSIGCAPCTRAIAVGEDFRAGRWWWEDSTKECGLHAKS